MDARDQLRRFLEQRRELGEAEFVLDELSVDDALRAIGVRAKAAPPAPGGAEARTPDTMARRTAERAAESGDWREALRRIGAEKPGEATAARAAPPAEPDSIEAIARAVAACTACGLHATAKNPVPGSGSTTAKFVCVGEAPGATEDEQGLPFVGAAGQLLTKILAAINLAREDVFICNVLKHRPPGNRNPEPDEIRACSPFLLRQLEVLKPRVILALGAFAAQTLLQTKQPIGKLRGQLHRYHGVPLIVTYHPAALLRDPKWKRPTWEDVQLARRVFDSAAGA